MIAACLRAKLRDRGALGFAADAVENALGLGLIAGWSGTLALAATGALFASPLLIAWEFLATGPLRTERPHFCNVDCGTDTGECEGDL